MVIGTNLAFINILRKRGLLYDAFDPSRVVKKKPSHEENEYENDDDGEYYDDML